MHDVGTVPFADRLIGAGQVTVKPVVGVTTGLRVTEPAKLNVLLRAIDNEAPVAPVLKLTGVAAVRENPPT